MMNVFRDLWKRWESCSPAWSRSTRRRYWDGFLAIILFFLAQLLICALQHATVKIDFPAPIMAMVAVAVLMIAASRVLNSLDGFYHAYLRRPVNLLNRHMSIGFTVPLTMVLRGPMPRARDVGLIAFGFLVTGVLNSILVYATAQSVHSLLRWLSGRGFTDTSPKYGAGSIPTVVVDLCGPCLGSEGRGQERSRKCMSEASTLTNNPSFHDISDVEGDAVDPEEDTPPGGDPAPSTSKAFCRASLSAIKRNPVLFLALVAIPTIATPMALVASKDTPFDTFLLLFLWTGTLAAQSSIKRAACLRPFPRRHSLLTTLMNAVLWTSLGMIAYIMAKVAVKHTTIEAVLDDFTTNTTLADIVHARPTKAIGAGDIAVSVLNAGIVSWGLKLFECRRQLLSMAGLATLLVSTVAALGNVVGGPLLVHSLGVRPPARCLAFAARSVTLALAGPAMANLGGDVGLNAAMVVMNGILFQMGMGAGAASGSRAAVDAWRQWRVRGGEPARDVEKNLPQRAQREAPVAAATRSKTGGKEEKEQALRPDEPRTVAVGVAVGTNAAAMGTAYLYETGNRAAPYAAVSMTIFGVMTVAFTTIQPLADWVVVRVA